MCNVFAYVHCTLAREVIPLNQPEVFTDTQVNMAHQSANVHENTAHEMPDDSKSLSTKTFICTKCNQTLPVSEAMYPHARQPAMCRSCARRRRDERRARAAQRSESLDEIPPKELRGGMKRVTLTLSRLCCTAIDVLGLDSSASEVVEQAIMDYLRKQRPEVISFILFTHHRNSVGR
jgi:hypothetical protein